MRYVYKIEKITSWLLLFIVLFLLLSGFFITKHSLFLWINYDFAYYLHVILFPIIFIPIFYLHSLAGIFILMQRIKFFRNKYLKIIIGLFWTFIFVFFGFIYFAQSSIKDNKTEQNLNSVKSYSIILNNTEIRKHNNRKDCWLVIDNKVYNVTSYIPHHPDGPNYIITYCGQEATSAYTGHSVEAKKLLNSFLVGNMGEKIIKPIH